MANEHKLLLFNKLKKNYILYKKFKSCIFLLNNCKFNYYMWVIIIKIEPSIKKKLIKIDSEVVLWRKYWKELICHKSEKILK